MFSSAAYGTSKIAVTALSKIQARALSQDPREDILLNAVSQKFMKQVLYKIALQSKACFIGGGGTGGRGTGGKGGRRGTGGRRRGGRKRDSQGGGKREKKGKITQHYTIFCNRKNAKGREPKNTGQEPGLKGTGSGRFKPPCPPHFIIKRA